NIGDTITDVAGDTSATYTDANGVGIRYARTNETGLTESDSFAQGVGSTALGFEATAVGGNALALGRNSQANNQNSIAVGFNSRSSINGAVALGSGSISDRALAPATGMLPAG